ncbi:hypothetical protein SEPCBS57363_003268 [Sporothrix epigloea]|uniref:Uncharacterized protein n=1 Tax=Sporothrix epigloea TaxID=1892477 RepID=A0ABP0DKK4_9PEZI
MAYQQLPYVQTHPPPGYGPPGSTAYFTAQQPGGQYVPISSNPAFYQAQGTVGMVGNSFAPPGVPPGMPPGVALGTVYGMGNGGQMFNGWPGSLEEQEKQRAQAEAQAQAQAQAETQPLPQTRSKRSVNKHSANKKEMNGPSKSWDQVVADIKGEQEAYGGSQDDRGSYDHCDCSGSESSCSGSEGVNSNDNREKEDDDDDDGDTDVAIQPGGTGRVVVYLNHKNQNRPPNRTCFLVSARRMRAEARRWLHMCHRGSDRYDTTVGDGAAVVGMYWLLQALHTGLGEGTGNEYNYDSGDVDGYRLRTRATSTTTPRALSAALPTELPARVFAYATMFAHQFGVLDRGPQALPDSTSKDEATDGIHTHNNTTEDRFRTRAEIWLHAIMGHPRHRDTFDSSIIAPGDWPFLLYASRVLADRTLFATCLRTLLDRWYVDELGVFCDAQGPVRIDQLPASMRDIVFPSLKAARERSVDTIINGAVGAFSYVPNKRQ